MSNQLFVCLFLLLSLVKYNAQNHFSDTVLVSKSHSDYSIVREIVLEGNKKTRPSIVLRELTFSKNDTVYNHKLLETLERSRQNLLNTSLFNFVTINYTISDSNKITVVINVAERWYLFPVPIFEIAERNFNTWWETKNLSRANYGVFVTKENFRGRKETLIFKLKLGYSQQYGVSYQIPYINKQQTSGLGFTAYYYRNHGIAYKTEYNKLLFFNDAKYTSEEFAANINYKYRQGLYNTYQLTGAFNTTQVLDVIRQINSDYFLDNPSNLISYFSAAVNFKRDIRDSKIYPLTGYFFDIEVNKLGMGILKNESINNTSFSSTIKKYWKCSNRLYFASSLKGKYAVNEIQPYYANRALGFKDYVRGYEYYVVDGTSYGLMKLGIKHQLIKPHIKKLASINSEKFDTFHYAFYVELFSDIAYVINKTNIITNNFSNTVIYGNGIGIDFVTYYDNVFRLEYSINKNNQGGIFLHIYAPI